AFGKVGRKRDSQWGHLLETESDPIVSAQPHRLGRGQEATASARTSRGCEGGLSHRAWSRSPSGRRRRSALETRSSRVSRSLCSLPSCAFHPPKPRPRYLRYLVEPGDTLTAISDRYGLPLGTIARANRFDPARILLAGATLRIPVSAARRSAAGRQGVQAVLDRWAAH